MKSFFLAMALLTTVAIDLGCSKGHFTASLKSLKMKEVHLEIDPKFKQIVSRLDFELSDDAESCAIARDELRADIDDLPLTVTGNGGPGGSGLLTGKPDICLQFLFETKWPMGTVAGWPNGEMLYKPPGIISTLTIRDDSETISMRMLDLFRAPPENVVALVAPADGFVRHGETIEAAIQTDSWPGEHQVSVAFKDSRDNSLKEIRGKRNENGRFEFIVSPEIPPGPNAAGFWVYWGPKVLGCTNATSCGGVSYPAQIATFPMEIRP